MRPFIKVLIILACTVASAVIGLLLYVRFADLDIWRDDLERLVSEASGFDVIIDGPLDVEIGGQVAATVEEVSIVNAGWADDPLVAKIGGIRLALNTWSLLFSPIEINSIDLSDATIKLETNTDGNANWRTTTPADETANDGERPVLHRMQLDNIRISYNDLANATISSASVDSLSLIRNDTGTHNLEASGVVGNDDQAITFELISELELTERDLSVSDSRLDIDDNSLNFSGKIDFAASQRPDITAMISSPRIDLGGPAAEVDDAADDNEEANESEMSRVFSDAKLSESGLDAANIKLQLAIEELLIDKDTLRKVNAVVSLSDGALAVDPVSFNKGEGKVSANLSLEPENGQYTLALSLDAQRVRLAALAAEDQDPETVPPLDLRLEFGGSGDSLHAIAASSSGSISGAHHAGQINMQGSGLLFSDMITSVLRALNPFSETEEYANLECSIIEVRIEDGIATVEEMAAQLDKLKIIGRGEIDLDTEQLDMTMRTKTREGFGVSIGGVVNSFLAIGGTLSEPALNVDPAGSVTTAGAAVATGGMSVLAKSLWDRLSAEVDICSEEATQ